MPSTQVLAVAVPAFLASLVEFVEALTIVLAVSVTRGWRPALIGTGAGVVLLVLLVLVFGPALALVPIAILQLVIGVLLLLFGLRWLRKAVLRAGGAIALHDEESIYHRQRSALSAAGTVGAGVDTIGILTAFKAVVLEGFEVVFIVLAIGAAGGAWAPAIAGAAAAGVVVVGLGAAVNKPLSRLPENALKFAVGVLLSAFGTFWTGEALGAEWPGADLAIVALAAGYTVAALAGVAVVRARRRARIVA